ncbi:hypothetical protein AVEN_14786-1 [Araneus ventricosus]|uniref:Uncharacterized protein n=1 Tax=Araneus ventricosus TaxID=182803 RepID=A0A4Y2FHY5_ARAVE|nr:hypothetical protein AVEN_14786-1 [Araneus ventricosus]
MLLPKLKLKIKARKYISPSTISSYFGRSLMKSCARNEETILEWSNICDNVLSELADLINCSFFHPIQFGVGQLPDEQQDRELLIDVGWNVGGEPLFPFFSLLFGLISSLLQCSVLFRLF